MSSSNAKIQNIGISDGDFQFIDTDNGRGYLKANSFKVYCHVTSSSIDIDKVTIRINNKGWIKITKNISNDGDSKNKIVAFTVPLGKEQLSSGPFDFYNYSLLNDIKTITIKLSGTLGVTYATEYFTFNFSSNIKSDVTNFINKNYGAISSAKSYNLSNGIRIANFFSGAPAITRGGTRVGSTYFDNKYPNNYDNNNLLFLNWVNPSKDLPNSSIIGYLIKATTGTLTFQYCIKSSEISYYNKIFPQNLIEAANGQSIFLQIAAISNYQENQLSISEESFSFNGYLNYSSKYELTAAPKLEISENCIKVLEGTELIRPFHINKDAILTALPLEMEINTDIKKYVYSVTINEIGVKDSSNTSSDTFSFSTKTIITDTTNNIKLNYNPTSTISEGGTLLKDFFQNFKTTYAYGDINITLTDIFGQEYTKTLSKQKLFQLKEQITWQNPTTSIIESPYAPLIKTADGAVQDDTLILNKNESATLKFSGLTLNGCGVPEQREIVYSIEVLPENNGKPIRIVEGENTAGYILKYQFVNEYKNSIENIEYKYEYSGYTNNIKIKIIVYENGDKNNDEDYEDCIKLTTNSFIIENFSYGEPYQEPYYRLRFGRKEEPIIDQSILTSGGDSGDSYWSFSFSDNGGDRNKILSKNYESYCNYEDYRDSKSKNPDPNSIIPFLKLTSTSISRQNDDSEFFELIIKTEQKFYKGILTINILNEKLQNQNYDYAVGKFRSLLLENVKHSINLSYFKWQSGEGSSINDVKWIDANLGRKDFSEIIEKMEKANGTYSVLNLNITSGNTFKDTERPTLGVRENAIIINGRTGQTVSSAYNEKEEKIGKYFLEINALNDTDRIIFRFPDNTSAEIYYSKDENNVGKIHLKGFVIDWT